jgi:hypothetical protein
LIFALATCSASASAAPAPTLASEAAPPPAMPIFPPGADLQPPPRYLPAVGGRIQFRSYLNWRDDDGLAEDVTTGFQLRRTRFHLRGTLPADFSYFVELDFNRLGAPGLLDIYGDYNLGQDWRVRFGQFVVPLLRERGVPDRMQLTAERSIVNDVFEPDYTQGLMLARDWEQFRFSAAFTDGVRTRSTDIDNPREADWALTGRAEYRLGGESWARVQDFTSWRGDEFVALFGGGLHAQSGGDTFATPAPLDRDMVQYTADISLKGPGWNAFAAFVGRRLETEGNTFNDYGFVGQGGFFVTEQTELFGRYDIVMPDDAYPAGDDFATLTLGVNHYFIPRSHALKFTGDVLIFLDRQSGSSSLVLPSTGQGLLASDASGQLSVRLQMLVVF